MMIDCMVFNAVFKQNFKYISAVSAPINAFQELFSPVLSTIFFLTHWLLSKQWTAVREESCQSDYPLSSEGIFAEPGIKPATSCAQVLYATDCDIYIKDPLSVNKWLNTSTKGIDASQPEQADLGRSL